MNDHAWEREHRHPRCRGWEIRFPFPCPCFKEVRRPPASFRLLAKAASRRPLHQDRHKVPDRAVIKGLRFFSYNFLNGRPWSIGEALAQSVNDSHQGMWFVVYLHPLSVDRPWRAIIRCTGAVRKANRMPLILR